MAFDFKKAREEAFKDINNKSLGLLVLGQSGAGKSSLGGTFGLNTLYLYTSGESHGAKSANSFGENTIIPVRVDSENGVDLHPDKAYERLLETLRSPEQLQSEGIQAVVLDGLTEIEILIRGTTKWKLGCQTDKGFHNAWAEGKVTLALFRPIIIALKALSKYNIHHMVTCALDVISVSDNGEISESKPRLQTYSVAEGVLQQFEDIVVIGRMTKNNKVAHRLQFLAGVARESKDDTGVIRKSINFNPRIGGIPLQSLPNTLNADLKEVIKLKEGKLQ